MLYLPNIPPLREFDFSDLTKYHWGDLSFDEHAALVALPDHWPQIREHMDSLTDAQWKLLDAALDKVFAQSADAPSAEHRLRTRSNRAFLTAPFAPDHHGPHADG